MKPLRGHPVPPHDYCHACFKGDSTRAILIAGTQEWMSVAFAVIADFDDDTAADVIGAVWEVFEETDREYAARGIDKRMAEYVPGRRYWWVRLCRHCAERARAEFVKSGSPTPPGIYNANRALNNEYEYYEVHGIVQPYEEESA